MKILAAGDLHCGHILGLTPPSYQNTSHKMNKIISQYWGWFKDSVKGNYDVAIWNGDLVEGEGRHETSHHLTTDINEQIEMAIEIIKTVGARKNIFIYGTPYHAGTILDYEAVIAKEFNSDIHSRQKVEIDGVKFDIMHTVGKSGTPVGGDIMLTKAGLWSMIYDVMDGRPHADIILRSHAHEFRYTGNSQVKAFLIPALKLGKPDFDRYARRLDGRYNVGFLEFHYKKGDNPLNVYPITKLFPYQISGGYKKI